MGPYRLASGMSNMVSPALLTDEMCEHDGTHYSDDFERQIEFSVSDSRSSARFSVFVIKLYVECDSCDSFTKCDDEFPSSCQSSGPVHGPSCRRFRCCRHLLTANSSVAESTHVHFPLLATPSTVAQPPKQLRLAPVGQRNICVWWCHCISFKSRCWVLG